MNVINKDFNKIILYKKKSFFYKKSFFLKHIKFSCFLKQNYVSNKKQVYNYHYNLFRQLDNLFGVLPKIFNLNLKYTNKKKKLKTKLFIKINIKTTKNHTFFFLEVLLIKYFYFYLKSLELIKLKDFNMLKETINTKIYNKIKIKKDSLMFNILFLKNFLNFNKKFKFKKYSLFFKKYKKETKNLLYNDSIKFKIKFTSSCINYFFKLFKIIILNNFKIKILMHKNYMKYKKILEKA